VKALLYNAGLAQAQRKQACLHEMQHQLGWHEMGASEGHIYGDNPTLA
jgi:hypothetical protein